ncbi:signal peptidase I [Patescibacteria group bacterium]|nr:signal peptidase I [Patescibacteria group bacterium]MBU4453412.1 signal peptidase I [Patescibacteria group bacterium]MCG2687850.1 signal peptidase I [Candidatus Parcubacteria bacterium]
MSFSENKESAIIKIFGATLGGGVIFILELLQIVIIAAAIIIPIRYFLIQPFIVKGASMEPSFEENEYLIIDELSYRFRDVERGEIIVFEPPANEDQYYIKRVIGLPGETVELQDGKITIYNDQYPNGFTLQEDYIDEYTYGEKYVVLGDTEYFVMGDNRDVSLDSRASGVGPIPEENIVGRVWLRGLPFTRAGFILTPEYSIQE